VLLVRYQAIVLATASASGVVAVPNVESYF